MLDFIFRSVLIGAIAFVAALLFERGLAHLRKGTRFAWTFALLATLVLPWVPPLQTSRVVSDVVPEITVPALVVTAVNDLESTPAVDVVLAICLALSALVLAFYAISFARLLRARATWRAGEVASEHVFLSHDFGPAVFGFAKPRIVIPEWVRATSQEEQALIVRHEREHIAARDQLQLLWTLIATAIMPWNPFVWLQARALRFRVEADCDQRVLTVMPDRAAYAKLLVHVGGKQSGLLLTPALAEHRNGLERRLTMVATKLIARRWKAALLMVGGIVLTVVACESRLPNEAPPAQPEPTQLPRKTENPEFAGSIMPMTPEMAQLVDQYYPPLLRSAGVGGRVVMRVRPNAGGISWQIAESSGRRELDAAAERVMQGVHLVPTLREGTGEFHVVMDFDPNSRPRKLAPSRVPLRTREVVPTDDAVSTAPVFTPYDEQPRLSNRNAVAGALVDSYPPALRDAGIGGTTIVWVLVGTDGKVAQASPRIHKRSGRTELDEAALEVARVMEFDAAKLKGKPVPVWIQLPIVFKTQ